jgi:hypothetical protein
VNARRVILPPLMTVVDALGRGERVEFLDVPFNVPAWLIEPCRGSC